MRKSVRARLYPLTALAAAARIEAHDIVVVGITRNKRTSFTRNEKARGRATTSSTLEYTDRLSTSRNTTKKTYISFCFSFLDPSRTCTCCLNTREYFFLDLKM